MRRLLSFGTLLAGGAMIALIGGAAPATADDIYPDEIQQVHDLTFSLLGAEELGGVVAQPIESAWQQIPQSTDQLSEPQQREFQQLKSGTIEYLVEIPPEEREEGGPTHKVVTAPAPFGGLDHMVEVLTGEAGFVPGSQMQSTDIGSLSPAGFLQNDLGDALGGGSVLSDALAGFQN